MKPPRILFLSPRLPYPLNSGTKIRISHLLQAMTELGEVDFICYGYLPEIIEFESLNSTPTWWNSLRSITILPHPSWNASNPDTLKDMAKHNPFAKNSIFYSSFPNTPMRALSTDHIEQADLVWAERLHVAHSIRTHAHKTIVDLDDLESIKLERLATVETRGFTRWALLREAQRMKHMEHKTQETFLRTVVCSQTDAEIFSNSTAPVSVLPNGVDDALLTLVPPPTLANRLVFVGTLNYGPNEEALIYFCSEILPIILAKNPETVLDIVGLKPTQRVSTLADNKHVFIHANVPDVAPYVQRASVSIVPLRVGGGTRLKILESLALGTPVVSTSIGAEGLDLIHDEHLILADTPELFAQAVIRSLEDENLGRRLATLGLQQVKRKYLWSSIRHNLASQCQELLDAQTNRSPAHRARTKQP